LTDADAPYERAWLGARFLVRPLGRALLRPEVVGRAHVPRTGGAVIAFNHVGYLDVLLVTQVLERPTRFMVAEGVLRVPGIALLLRTAGAFGVRRGASDRDAVRLAIEIATAGGLVGIFPEGGLRRGAVLGELHRGAALIALRARVPLVPVAIHRRPAFVRVGEPLAPEGDVRSLTDRLGQALSEALGDRSQDPEGDRSHAIRGVAGGVEGREGDGADGELP
jgi:1-acyl-sn-glycerol-3-phosphate acyltransferase